MGEIRAVSICPFCKAELEKGTLQSVRPIVWCKGFYLPLFKKKEEKKNSKV